MTVKIKNLILKLLLYFINKAVKFFYTSKLKKYENKKIRHQPIFIIGAPRTGSTIFYQAMSNYFDVSYIDNCADYWYKNLFFGFVRSYNKFGNKPHNIFKSEYGTTNNYSEHAPSECGNFWYRWLPSNRHFVDFNEVSEKSKLELYSEVCAITNYFDKPLLFKNLNAGQRLRFLKEVFPKARFIFIRRDHEKVKSSILEARKKNNIDTGKIWSVMPREYEDLTTLSESDMVSYQINRLEKQILQDSHLFDEFYTIHFNDFSQQSILDLGDKLNIKTRKGGVLPIFNKDA